MAVTMYTTNSLDYLILSKKQEEPLLSKYVLLLGARKCSGLSASPPPAGDLAASILNSCLFWMTTDLSSQDNGIEHRVQWRGRLYSKQIPLSGNTSLSRRVPDLQGFDLKMEPAVGFEPTTGGLQNRCSTTELCWQNPHQVERHA